MLRLPTYQELSEEQEAVNNLFLRGNHLVIGPPGTGKTVMALYRARVIANLAARAIVPYRFLLLVYNKPLELYMAQAMTQLGVHETTHTFHSWMWRWYRQRYGLNPPTLAGESYMPDWSRILAVVANDGNLEKWAHLLVDEGQDLPKEFYILARLIAENVTVFADENQRINQWNSTIAQIRTYLGIQEGDVLHLRRNYRNTKQIAEFAREYYTMLQTGIPELPDRSGAKPKVVGFVPCGEAARQARHAGLVAQVAYIERYFRAHGDERIGVALPTWQQQDEFLRLWVRGTAPQGVLSVIDGQAQNLATVNFGESGVFLIRYGHAKGLEFDTMFLPDLDGWQTDADAEIPRMQFYVMTSRPRKELHLLFTGEVLPSILSRVPENLYLRRRFEVEE